MEWGSCSSCATAWHGKASALLPCLRHELQACSQLPPALVQPGATCPRAVCHATCPLQSKKQPAATCPLQSKKQLAATCPLQSKKQPAATSPPQTHVIHEVVVRRLVQRHLPASPKRLHRWGRQCRWSGGSVRQAASAGTPAPMPGPMQSSGKACLSPFSPSSPARPPSPHAGVALRLGAHLPRLVAVVGHALRQGWWW